MTELILASTSETRAKILIDAGIKFNVIAAKLDERAIESTIEKHSVKPDEIALVLAEKKSIFVSSTNQRKIVIGADQVLSKDGKRFHKPYDIDSARSQLLELSGNSHFLHSAVVCSINGKPIWKHVSHADLKMRNLSTEFIDWYIREVNHHVLKTVGCYQIEGIGIQLFEKIDGDFFTILGLPIIPLLKFLRENEFIGS